MDTTNEMNDSNQEPFRIQSTELLNTIKYNYGKLSSSNCADLSEPNNRLAICTDKCIFIINLNLSWPQAPSKYLANFKKLSKNIKNTNEFAKQSFNFDAWIQDLNDNKNELVYLNLIRNIQQSTQVESVYKEYITIETTLKRKPFHRLIREQVSKDKDVIESNLDQYLQIKHFVNQTKLFDADLYDYLSFLNPITNPNQNNDSKNAANKSLFSYFYYGFKYCKWNRNPDLNLLCVITACNQLILFDCTLLNNQNRDNMLSNDNSNVYDQVTGSKFINLTEYWLLNHKMSLLKNKSNSIDDFYTKIKQILPLKVCWSKPIQLNDQSKYGKQIELLFVALKSCEISVFIVYLNAQHDLEIDFMHCFNLNKKSESSALNEYEDESAVPNMLNDDESNLKISSLSFWQSAYNGILSIGYLNGEIQLIEIELNSFSLREKCSLRLDSLSLLNEIERIQLVEIYQSDKIAKFLLIAKKEHSIEFKIIKLENNVLKVDSSLLYEVDQSDDVNNMSEYSNNYIIKNHNKAVDFRMNNFNQLNSNELNAEILIWFENSNIKYLKLGIKFLNESTDLKLINDCLINNTIELKFDLTQAKSQKKHDYFKINRNLFLSTNNYLIFQLNDFNKLELIERKITQIELNIYRIKPLNNLLNNIIPTQPNDIKRTNVNDLIWLFKRQLYLNRDFYDQKMFQYLNSCLKVALTNPNINYLKLNRLISLVMSNYYETVSYFEYFNDKEEIDEEEDETDSVSSEEMEEEESNDSVKPAAQSLVIKSSPYYLSMFRDFTLALFKSYTFQIIDYACLNINELTFKEKLVFTLLAEFAIKKNFFEENPTKETEIKLLINDLNDFKSLKCDLCDQAFKINDSNEINKIECQQGHLMNRCEKTLLPLNNFKFKKCFFCSSKWNYLNRIDYPNFSNIGKFFSNQNNCLFCS